MGNNYPNEQSVLSPAPLQQQCTMLNNPYTTDSVIEANPEAETITPVQVFLQQIRSQLQLPHRLRTVNAIRVTTQPQQEISVSDPQQAIHVDEDDELQLTPLQKAQRFWEQTFRKRREQEIQIHDGKRPILLSAENEKSNHKWGDSLQEKAEKTTRVYGLNVNGLNMDARGGQFDVLCKVMKEVGADVMCGQEHNLDSDQTFVRSTIMHTTRNHWQRSKATFGTTPVSYKHLYKPGGTFMVTAGDLTGRLLHEKKDRWGRWVSQTYKGKGSLVITIFSAYQVVDKAISPGSTTTAAQQQSLLIQNQDPTTNPRTAFRRDLTTAILSAQVANQEVLLLGDFNEVFGSDPEGMTKVAVACNLIDLMTQRHSTSPPATYARGKKRLDYALGSQHMANSLTKAGYEPFNIRFHSDHRAYFLDFDTEKLFGADTQVLGQREPRVLQSTNVKQNTRYIRTKYQYLLQRNAFDRGAKLSRPGNRHKHAEKLDKDLVQASLAAEAKLRPYGSPAWSIKLDKARKLVLDLKRCASMARTGLDHLSQLQTSSSQTDFHTEQFEIPTTLADCILRLTAAEKDVASIVKNSFAQRDSERQDRIMELEASNSPHNRKCAKRLRGIQQAEAKRQLFQKINPLRKPDQRKGVTRIEIPLHPEEDPKSCTEWKQIDVPTEVLHHLKERNRKHFGQAHGSPFTILPLSNDVGYCGDGPSAVQIVNGSYDASGLDSNVALLLRHLQQTEAMAAKSKKSTITEQDYCAKLKVWKESTTTSPSGMHLGHYKSMISRHDFSDANPNDEEEMSKKEELDHMQECLLTLHVQLLNYALKRGYSYTRWQTVINSILFKDLDNVRINRTRIIHLYEADYNLMLGIKWREALYRAEDLRELNEGQYGSRPNRNAVDPVFLEEMQFEIARASRKTMVQTNYDATSCYDRIIIGLAMLVSQKFGVPRTITQSNAKTLEKAEYRIRTELGVADHGYRHSLDHPIYGTGQGSANSPMIWCFLSSILFHIYDSLCHKALYCNPDRSNSVDLGMLGFVDDSNGQTNLFMTNEDENTLPTILNQVRHNAQVWNDVLATSGGALELPKCSSHVVVWTFSDKGDPVLIHTQQPGNDPLTVLDSLSNNTHVLQFLSPYTAHKTLGHYKDPAGKQTTQYKELWSKSDKATEFLWKCSLKPEEAWLYYYACYLPSIGYPLPCSSLKYAQCDRIQRKALSIIVPKCGFNRHTKREIIFGPKNYGGAGFKHLYMRQGVGQIMTFLRHWRQQLAPGHLLQNALAWHQLSVGVSYSIISRVKDELPHCESVWIASMRTFLAEINASIEVDNPGIPQPQRQGDEYIMDMILESTIFTKAQIRRLNYCRLYLQAVTLSDITDTDGAKLDMSKRVGVINEYSSQTQWLHVRQDRPSPSEWLLWRKANLIWSHQDGSLHAPLGNWLHSIHDQRQQHHAYFRRRGMSSRIYIRRDKFTYIPSYPVQDQPMLFEESNSLVNFCDLPSNLQPVEVEPTDITGCWQLKSTIRSSIPLLSSTPIAETFSEFVATMEPWEADLLNNVTMSDDPYTICEALTDCFRGGSDGSVRYHKEGAFGWILSTIDGERLAKGAGPARGPKPTSYRAEACGLLSILRFLIRLAEYTARVEPWQGRIVSDSESVLKTLAGIEDGFQGESHEDDPITVTSASLQHLDVLCPDWDILIELQSSLKVLPQVTLQYIKAHQDDDTPYERLPLMAQLNCDADQIAGAYQDQHGSTRPLILMTPNTRAILHLSAGSVTGNYESQLNLAYSGPRLVKHLCEKYKWSDTVCASINWEVHGTCIRKQSKHHRHFVQLVNDILPTNAWLNKMDKGTRTCPCCVATIEDRDHILRCPHPMRDKWRHALLQSVSTYCTNEFTFPPMQILLMDVLRQWLYLPTGQEFIPAAHPYPEYLQVLISAQTKIGWRQMFNGRFCLAWSELQDDYYYRERYSLPTKKKTGHKWLAGLLNLIWREWYVLWKIRNEDVHGKDMATRAAAEKKEVSRQLHEIYDLRTKIEPSARELLCADIRTHLEQPTWVIQNWLANNPVSFFRASAKTATKRAIQGVASIRNYFGTVTQAS